MQDIQRHYDDLSERYDAQRSNRYFRLIEEVELDVLRRFLPPAGGRVLEVGCGSGIFLQHLSEIGLVSLHGMDYSSGMLHIAATKLQGSTTSLVHGNAVSLPYASEFFDVVYSFKVLPHVPDIHQGLIEIRRVLSPRGIAIVEFYNRHSIRRLLHRGGYFHRWQSPGEIHRQIKQAGLALVGSYGVRIALPLGRLMDIPGLRAFFYHLEKSLTTTSLNRFAGYYLAVCRRRPGT